MTFVLNTWYCAGWASELLEKPKAITICGRGIMLFRDSVGDAYAMEDRCPHRFAPLSQGKVIGDRIQCPYHGLEFDRRGACVFNPHGKQVIPVRPPLKTYAVHEQNGVLWIWMGDPEQADKSKVLKLDFLDDERYLVLKGHFMVKANYQLLNDNLLDLSHVPYIHPTTVGMPPKDVVRKVTYKARADAEAVYTERFLPDVAPTAQFLGLFKPETGDIHLHLTWRAPSSFHLDLSIVPCGTPKRATVEPDDQAMLIPGAHLMVPETADTTHYFYAVSRSTDITNEEKTAAMRALYKQTLLDEDMPMIEACHRLMGGKELMDLKPLVLESDLGSMLARKIINKLLAKQHGAHVTDTVTETIE